MRKGTVILISFLLGLILVGGYILYDNYKNTQASTTTYYSVTLSTEDEEKGTVENLEDKEYKAGEKIVLRAKPTEDYSFSGWYIEDKLLSTQNPYTYEVKEEVTIVAKFAVKEEPEEPEVPVTYTVTLTAGEGGSVTPLAQTTYESGAKITLAATANEGYTFSGFYEDSTLISSENPHTYTVTKDIEIRAMFEVTLQTTSAKYFTFDGNACTGYVGDPNAPEIIIPKSYSIINELETVIGAKVLNKDEIMFSLRDFTSVTFSDGSNNIHTYSSMEELTSIHVDYQNECYLTDIILESASGAMWFVELYNMQMIQFPVIINGQIFDDGETAFNYINENNITSINFSGEMEVTKFVDGNDYQVTSVAGTFNSQSGFINYQNKIVLLDNITSIGSWAFYDCSNVKSIVIPSSVTTIGDRAFMSCSSLTNIEIPNGITSIESYTFQSCSSLENIILPNTLQNIRGYSFRFCTSLKSIVLPSSVTNIELQVFEGCTNLETITILATTPPTLSGIGAITINTSVTKIYIPEGTLDAYQSAENWSRLLEEISEDIFEELVLEE